MIVGKDKTRASEYVSSSGFALDVYFLGTTELIGPPFLAK